MTETLNIPQSNLANTRHLREYQVEGIKFLLDNKGGIIGDQMGLGKTAQALIALRQLRDSNLLNGTTLIVVKSALVYQWIAEYKDWSDNKLTGIFYINSSSAFIPPGFDSYIISMDTLKRIKVESLLSLNLECLVIDEVHSYKNLQSARAENIAEINKAIEFKWKIFLSGTPIINSASEFFLPLHLLNPTKFPSLARFQRDYLMRDYKGKWSRINPYAKTYFQSAIEPYYLRRERSNVLKDLPKFQRNYEVMSITDPKFTKIYNAAIKRFEQEMEAIQIDTGREVNMRDVMGSGSLMELRRIVGMAKAGWVADFVIDHLQSTESEKIAVGIHHKDVRHLIASYLEREGYHVVTISGEDNAEDKNYKVQQFSRDNYRVAVINMIAGGTGLNLQFCNNAIVCERQWASAYEEQFEDRFNRMGQQLPVTITYPILMNSVDQFLNELVEEKRVIFDEAVNNMDVKSEEYDALRQTSKVAVQNFIHKVASSKL